MSYHVGAGEWVAAVDQFAAAAIDGSGYSVDVFHVPTRYLRAGEVGYICASIKQVKDARVGDTVTLAERPAKEMLPGYKKVQPMVYCGIYPAEGEKYDGVKDALEKLQVNDAAFLFEPETSTALGYGFRCGFLGLLHMPVYIFHLVVRQWIKRHGIGLGLIAIPSNPVLYYVLIYGLASLCVVTFSSKPVVKFYDFCVDGSYAVLMWLLEHIVVPAAGYVELGLVTVSNGVINAIGRDKK